MASSYYALGDDNRIIAEGSSYLECSENARATGVWDMTPGTVAPYMIIGRQMAKHILDKLEEKLAK